MENAFRIRESAMGLLKQIQISAADSYMQHIDDELRNRGINTYERIKGELEAQLVATQKRLEDLNEERMQYLTDLEFSKAILEEIRINAQRAPLRSLEKLRDSEGLRGIFKKHGFDLSAINPLFFPYYQQVILTIAENQNYDSDRAKTEYLRELSKSLQVTPENVANTFPEIRYDFEHITPSQALFTFDIAKFLVDVPEEKKRNTVRKLKALYAKYFHPDSGSSPFEKDTIQELFKIGFPHYQVFENKF